MTFEQNIGYYLYNKQDAQKLSLTSDPSSKDISLYKGWNLLSNSSDTDKKLSDMSYTYDSKDISLDKLISTKVGYGTYYLIKDPMGKTVEEAFEKIKTSTSNPGNSSIPAGKMFWFYIY
jgi:hypothetical protein